MMMVLALGTSIPFSLMVVQGKMFEALGDERAHEYFQFALVQLAMCHANACLGQRFDELGLAVVDGLDFVVQEVDLAAAFQLAQTAGFTDNGMD